MSEEIRGISYDIFSQFPLGTVITCPGLPPDVLSSQVSDFCDKFSETILEVYPLIS